MNGCYFFKVGTLTNHCFGSFLQRLQAAIHVSLWFWKWHPNCFTGRRHGSSRGALRKRATDWRTIRSLHDCDLVKQRHNVALRERQRQQVPILPVIVIPKSYFCVLYTLLVIHSQHKLSCFSSQIWMADSFPYAQCIYSTDQHGFMGCIHLNISKGPVVGCTY
jgi:hypothetical protein